MQYDTIIYGELTSVGGKEPNVNLDIGGQSVICKTTREQARELASRLYEVVGLEGTVTQDDVTGRIVGMSKVTSIVPYRWRPGDDPLDALRALEQRHRCYAGVNAAAFVRGLRG